MRIGILVISSLILFGFFAITASSVDWGNPGLRSADQMLGDQGDQGPIPTSNGPDVNPWQSRSTQIGDPKKDILSVPLGGNPDLGASSPEEAQSRRQEESQTTVTQPIATTQSSATTQSTATTQPVVSNSPISVQSTKSTEPTVVSGSWSLDLSDVAFRTAALTLFQNGDAVYGTGNMNLDANTTLVVTASGTVTGDQLNLDIVSLGKVSLYRNVLTVSGNSATGSYFVYSPGSPQSTGTVKGVRTVPSS